MAKTRTLYNEYRPKRFCDIVGQQVPVKTMTNAVKTGNITSAYLFSGPRGVGKTTCARIFARALLCIGDNNNIDGCGECQPCKEFDDNLSSDFIEIDAATNRGIDNIRDIKDRILMSPVSSHRKVILIDEVHHLTPEAATGLLKVLEEPPAGVVFLLATTDPQKIPATIRSRCQWLKFRPLENRQIEDRLSYVLGSEGISADPDVISLIAKRAEGGLRDALSMLDMLITYKDDRTLTIKDAEICFGVISQDLVEELTNYIIAKNFARIIGFTVRHRADDIVARDLTSAILETFSLALIVQKCGPDSALALEAATQASIENADKIAKDFSTERLIMACDTIERMMWKYDSSVFNPDHVFNEIMTAVADPAYDPKHLSLDEHDRSLINEANEKTIKITKAISTIAEMEKKNLENLTAINKKLQRQQK